MKTFIIATIGIGFLTHSVAEAMPSSLSWNLLPENVQELPLEISYDGTGHWEEIWVRPPLKPKASPRLFMEQTLGVRWMGVAGEGDKPSRLVLVFNEAKVADVQGGITRTGKIENGKIAWSDGTQSELFGLKKQKGSRKRSRKARKVHFGKISLPPIGPKTTDIDVLSVEGLSEFLTKVPLATSVSWQPEEFGVITRIADGGGSLFRMKYAADCKESDKFQIEKTLAASVDPQLTCWAQQNPEKAPYLLTALLQKPVVSCKSKGDCGRASLPLVEGFFVTPPSLEINTETCSEELPSTLLHEILHFAGIKDGEEMDKAVEQANSCALSADLSYDGVGEEFFNDLQVETRIALFKKVRDEAVEKWGWNEAEKSYVLGSICSRMGDKFCSRRYFQHATEGGGNAAIQLPEGKEVSFSAAAHFGLFDSISDDIPRMHELAKYLPRDPNGVLLKRLESGTHRLHEFYVARNALELIKNNKGVCNSEVTDKVSCEDLSLIVKYPWFTK